MLLPHVLMLNLRHPCPHNRCRTPWYFFFDVGGSGMSDMDLELSASVGAKGVARPRSDRSVDPIMAHQVDSSAATTGGWIGPFRATRRGGGLYKEG